MRAIQLIVLSCLLILVSSVDAEETSLTIHAKNRGINIDQRTTWKLYNVGERKKHLVTRYAGGSRKVKPGTYDLLVIYRDGIVRAEQWLEQLSVTGEVSKQVTFDLPISSMLVDIHDKGKKLGHKARWALYEPGKRKRPLKTRLAGASLTAYEGTYDIKVSFRDGEKEHAFWFENEKVTGPFHKIVELDYFRKEFKPREFDLQPGRDIDIPPGRDINLHARIHTTITRDGEPLPEAHFEVYRQGDEAGGILFEGVYDTELEAEDGIYDIKVRYRDGENQQIRWFKGRSLRTGKPLLLDVGGPRVSLRIVARSSAQAQDSQAASTSDESANESANIELILDASNSMWGQIDGVAKIVIAKEVLTKVIDRLPTKGVQVALRVYGLRPRAEHDCTDSSLIAPFATPDKALLKDLIADIQPKGYTPIAYSLKQAANDFPTGSNNSLVLVTDGIESCEGDPCQAAADLGQAGITSRSYVIGFALAENEKQSLACLGRYYRANDRKQLELALKDIIKNAAKPISGSVTVFEVGRRNKMLANGAVGEVLSLVPGQYDVLVRIGERIIELNEFDVSEDTEKVVQ